MASNEPSDLNWNTFRTYYVSVHGKTSGNELAKAWEKYKTRHNIRKKNIPVKEVLGKPSKIYLDALPRELRWELFLHYFEPHEILILCNISIMQFCNDDNFWIQKAAKDFNMSRENFLNFDIVKKEQKLNVLRTLSLKEKYEILSHKLPSNIIKLFNRIDWYILKEFVDEDLNLSSSDIEAGLNKQLLNIPIPYLYSVRFSMMPDYTDEEMPSFMAGVLPEYLEFDISADKPLTPREILSQINDFFISYDNEHDRVLYHIYFEGIDERYDPLDKRFIYEIRQDS